MAHALKAGAPLAFTYHHNKIEAYHAVGVAILDAGLVCSASIPCPAEMGGSIHIHGTDSSIVDSIFVCRANPRIDSASLFDSVNQLLPIVRHELRQLCSAGMHPTTGDVRCIVFGHVTRMSIYRLRTHWDSATPTQQRLEQFSQAVEGFGDPQPVVAQLAKEVSRKATTPTTMPLFDGIDSDAVPV